MDERIAVGKIVKGKVNGIQPYGAFIALDDNKQGLVHISEITHGYVKNIYDYFHIGDEVTVKVLAIDEKNGKISLSLKAVTEAEETREKQRLQEKNKVRLEKLLESSNDGFRSLKEKLNEWIEEQNTGLLKRINVTEM